MRRLRFSLLIAICASLALALGVCAGVRASTLPDISGRWYANGNSSHHCHIRQSGSSVSLTNERGATATGSFVDPSHLATNWGPFGGGNINGQISSDLNTITWSNGTRWTRAPAFTSSSSSTSSGFASSGYASSGSTPAPAATPKPYWYLNWANPGGPRAPIDYIDAWTAVMRNGTAGWTCLSFKNTSNVAATRILLGITLLNHNHHIVDKGHLDRKGTFSPNVEIHGWHDVASWSQRVGPRGYSDNCVSWDPNHEPRAREDYSEARYYSISVKRIEYTDGTTWPPAEEASPSPSPGPEASPNP